MARLSVAIGADVGGFIAGMEAMAASAKGAASSIDRSLSSAMGPTSATLQKELTSASRKLTQARQAEATATRQVTAAEERLATARRRADREGSLRLAATDRQIKADRAVKNANRAREDAIAAAAQKESDAARKVAIAESAVADAQAVRSRSTGAQLRAENALANAQVRHSNILRDSTNEILKARQAEERAAGAVDIAEEHHRQVVERGRLVDQANASSVARHNLAEMRATQALTNAEMKLGQEARASGLVRTQQNQVIERSTRDLTKAQTAYSEATGATGAGATAKLRAQDQLIRAQQEQAKAIQATSRVATDQAVKVNNANRQLQQANTRVAELSGTEQLAARRAEELTAAQGRAAAAAKAVAAAESELSAAQLRTTASSTGFSRAIQGVVNNKAKIDGVANSMIKVGGVGAIGFGLMAAAAVSWQKQWTEVTKTVDFTKSKWGSVTAAQDANEQSLRNLTKQLPATHTEIAQTAALLGTLGVGANDLAQFTKVATQLGTTTNLSSEQAATGLKQLMTVTGEVPNQVNNIGSALVALGLNGASTEKQILNTGLRIASAGKSIGFATEDTLALGSSLASVGIQAEAGGNNMATSLTKIDRAVRAGGPGLQKWADLAGMSGDQFKKAWGKDAPEAFAKVLDGLGKVTASGGNLTDTLRGMGIVNIREIRNMRDLALSTKAAGAQQDLFRDQLKLARDEREKGTKLDQTASITYQTAQAKMIIAWNQINDAAITAGKAFLPVIGEIAGQIGQAADAFGKLDPGLQGFLVKGGAIAAISVLALGGIVRMATGALSLVSAFRAASTGSGALAGSLRALQAAAGPVAFALLAVTVAGVALDKMGVQVKSVDDMTQALVGLTNGTRSLDDLYQKPGWVEGIQNALLNTMPMAENLGGALRTIGAQNTGNWFLKFAVGAEKLRESLIPGNQNLEKMQQTADNLDQSFVQLVQNGSIDQAGKAFTEVAHRTGMSWEELAPVLSGYKDALATVAENTYHVTLSDRELVDWMGGKVPAAISKSKVAMTQQGQAALAAAQSAIQLQESIASARDTLESLRTKQKLSVDAAGKLSQELFVQGNLFQNAAAGHLQYADAIDQASAVMAKNTTYTNKNRTALSDNTAKGRENITALMNLATAGKGWVQSLVAQGAGAKKAELATKDVRSEFVKTAQQAGLTKGAANKLADSYGLIPKQVSTKVSVAIDAFHQAQVDNLIKQLEGLPPEEATKIYAIYDSKGADAALAELKKFQDLQIKPKITVTVDRTAMGTVRTELQTFPDKHTVKIVTTTDLHGVKTTQTEITNTKGKTVKIITTSDLNGVKTTQTEIKNTKGKTVKIITTSNAAGVVTTTQRTIDSLTGKTVDINVVTHYTQTGTPAQAHAAGGSKAPVKATGGYITGPGTATSDSIPAWLSTGEYVIRAAAVKAIGLSSLHMMNARGYASGGVVRPPNVPLFDVAAIFRLIAALTNLPGAARSAAAAVNRAQATAYAEQQKVAGPKAALDRTTRAYDAARSHQLDLRDARDRLKRSQSARDDELRALKKKADATKGNTAEDKEYKRLKDTLSHNKNLTKVQQDLSRANTLVTRTSQAKSKATDAYNKVAEKAKEATQKLKDAQQALAEAQKAVADAAKAAGEQLAQPYRSASHDIDDWLDAMQRGQTDLKAFNKQVVDLRKRGLNETLIQQIAQQGAIVGGELAGQILAGGKKMVDSLNKANDGLQKASDNIGFAVGTGVGRYATGGPVTGPGTGTSDSITARLSSGEYIVNASATARNRAVLDMINYGTRTAVNDYMPHYATGGYVRRSTVERHVHGGDVNFNGQINVIDPDDLMRRARRKQQDSLLLAGLSVAI